MNDMETFAQIQINDSSLPAWFSGIALMICAFLLHRMMTKFDKAHAHHYEKLERHGNKLTAHDAEIKNAYDKIRDHKERLDAHDHELDDLDEKIRNEE